MLKRFITLLVGGTALAALFAAPHTTETPITDLGTSVTVMVSNTAWTLLSTTGGNIDGQTGAFVTNHSTNTSLMSVILSTSSTAPGEATTIRPIAVSPGQTVKFGMSNRIYIWGIYHGQRNGNAHVQEFLQ